MCTARFRLSKSLGLSYKDFCHLAVDIDNIHSCCHPEGRHHDAGEVVYRYVVILAVNDYLALSAGDLAFVLADFVINCPASKLIVYKRIVWLLPEAADSEI